MKKFQILFFSIVSFGASAQFMEFGGGPGIMNYSGDLVRGFSFSTTTVAGTAFYRMNFSEIVTLRLGLTIGSVKAAETPIDPFAIERDHSFKSTIAEVSSVFEYHFLDFKSEGSRINYSPYIFAGFGILNFKDAPPNSGVGRFHGVIPMGAGFKYQFKKKYTLGFEAGARKTFLDYLDGISDADQRVKDYQYGNPKDDDWYFFTGISLSITLFNIPCPFSYTPNNSLLDR